MTAGDLGKLIVLTVAALLVLGLILFGAAGTLAWPPGWAFLVLYLGFQVVYTAWLARNDPGLLRERTRPMNADQPAWDKAFIVALYLLLFAWLALMPLDAVRLRISHVPAWLQGVGAVLLLGALVLFFLSFRENSYLSPAVRVQRERGQRVVSTGPYRYVRHPMYSGFLPFVVGTALLLGSWYGLLLAIVLIGMVAWRAVREERTLREELEGYDAYMSRVRFRLIPRVW